VKESLTLYDAMTWLAFWRIEKQDEDASMKRAKEQAAAEAKDRKR
jgi:hypothetical protein